MCASSLASLVTSMADLRNLPAHLSNTFHAQAGAYLERVPVDVLVDRILVHLSVTELLRLRRVNKAFCILTHCATLWKQLFMDAQVPVPFVAEYPDRFAFHPSDFEYERLVAKCVSLEDNWTSKFPHAKGMSTLFMGCTVFEAKLMPGGKYLVASVKEVCGDGGGPYFGVHVYALLGHGTQITAKLIMALNTVGRVHELQARFVKRRRVTWLAIAFVRREYQTTGLYDLNTVDYDWESDDHKVNYIFEAGCLTMEEIEKATQSGIEYQDWHPLVMSKHTRRVQCIQFCTLSGIGLVVYVLQPAMFVFSFLQSGKTTVIPLVTEARELIEFQNRIEAIHLLPVQNRVIVLRTFTNVVAAGWDSTVHRMESHDLIVRNEGGRPRRPAQAMNLHVAEPHISFSQFWFSDPPLLEEYFDSPGALPTAPPPISVYGVSTDTRAFVHWTIHPVSGMHRPDNSRREGLRVDPSNRSLLGMYATVDPPRYSISQPDMVTSQPRYEYTETQGRLGVLPGVRRPLVYFLSGQKNVVCDLRRYQPHWMLDYGAPDLESWDRRVGRVATNRVNRAKLEDAWMKHPPPLVERKRDETWSPVYAFTSVSLIPRTVYERWKGQDACVMTWDETSGRLCVVSSPDMNAIFIDMGIEIERNRSLENWKLGDEPSMDVDM
ncbi:hypothetical protein CYLTODRAFT_485538 [Cylindrobasidium torrendii FP15055 ss-10]|uniref:F-box domain-containing protein n=1 Tax=Cylindrobasidium torrendii FP15055 ss-10 TaxID=1314674 RepID=A0A0D7BSK5_9AGAR|nr:hypothetical protein CYLTODRAFT_485538 [Cylindrobasidium torrendii FP15055 ss-10]